MPRGCDHAIHVKLDCRVPVHQPFYVETFANGRTAQRHFIVEYNSDGEVLRIKERKPKTPPMIGVYDDCYWKAGTHPLGTGDTLPKRIIAAAEAKRRAEDRAHNATP